MTLTGRPRVAIATAAKIPHLDEDGPALIAALAAAGVDAEAAVWDDPALVWDRYDLVLIRSTWDYTTRRDEFLAWADRVSAQTRLRNPAPVLRWNTDKRYLAELAERGVDVVPTTFVSSPAEMPMEDGPVVVKPAVSAGAVDTARYASASDPSATAHIRRLLESGRTAMVQPYVGGIDEAGETGLVFIGGSYSHAIRKGPILRAVPGRLEHGLYAREEITPRSPSAAELAAGERALAALPFPSAPLVYARVDLIPGADGTPLLLELELTEPSLFLSHGEDAPARLAAAAAACLQEHF